MHTLKILNQNATYRSNNRLLKSELMTKTMNADYVAI